ncbi:hypothetical protein DMENIID0001_039320 [Sergentomyia squamirostris]
MLGNPNSSDQSPVLQFGTTRTMSSARNHEQLRTKSSAPIWNNSDDVQCSVSRTAQNKVHCSYLEQLGRCLVLGEPEERC